MRGCNIKQKLSNIILKFTPTTEGFYDFEKNAYIYQYKPLSGSLKPLKLNKTIETKTILTSEKKANALDEDCERSSARVTYNKNMQIVDTNNYYPFGMNHLRDDTPSNFGQGSYKNYKYNGKGLQEIEVRDSPIHLKLQKEKLQWTD